MSAPSPAKILVVDDLPASRGLAAIWLSDGLRDGVEVLEADTLATMRAAWAEHRPDLVLLDQRLPDGEGLDGARELLAQDPDTAVILLTGMSDPALDEEAERVGVTDFLVKHEIDGPMLARAVRYALRRREDRRRLRRSEERYRNLVGALPDTGVVVVDEELRFVMAAGSALDQAGWNPEELVGQSAVEILSAAHRESIVDDYRAALAGVGCEREVTAPTGRTYRTAFRPLGDGEAMAVTIDITEQLAQAAELQRAQALASTGSWRWDAASEVMTWSPELCRIYGLDPSQPLPSFASFLSTMVEPADREQVARATREALRDGRPADFEMGIVRVGGERRVLHSRVRPVLDADGTTTRIEGVSQDVTRQREAERLRREAEQRFEVAFDRAPIGMFLGDGEGRWTRVNAALCRITGFTREELLGFGPLALVHPEDVAVVREKLAAVGDVDIALDHRLVHRDGHAVWVTASATLVRDAEGAPVHVLGQMQDVTARREYEERLKHLADHDPLTALRNRRSFEVALDAHVARTRRYGPAGALMVVDLDGFKEVNDQLGHAAGDELIVRCAAALRGRLRETDVLARLGGDEFAVLLPVEAAPQATVVAGALVDAVREAAAGFGGGRVAGVTASVGIATVDADTVTGDELLVRADLAMYAAKAAGRDRFAVFAPAAVTRADG
jgi:diguanylate cyclase (GGDEF)-like protein/PAS domain S-box-containing protein